MKSIDTALVLKEQLDALRPLSKEDELRIMQKFRLDWNYHSNHIEGNSLSYGETKALILFGITAQGKPLKDHFEMTGHNEAINWIIEVVNQKRPLTERFIRELHQLILKEDYQVDAITPTGEPTKKMVRVGQYKSQPNHVLTKTGEIFRFSSPEETPAKMKELLDWQNSKLQDENSNPILTAAEFHYRFIRIHPFDDGNGRTARILMNFILMQADYPPVVIKTDDKENYYSVLRQADAGILEPFLEFIVENLNHSLDIMIRGAKGENVEEEGDLEKEITLLEQKFKSLDDTFEEVKSQAVLVRVYKNVILNFWNSFKSKCELLNSFYVKHDFRLVEIIPGSKSPKIHAPNEEVHILSDWSEGFNLIYEYFIFKNFGFEEQFHVSVIYFKFENSYYTVSSKSGNVVLKKAYNELLTNEEIQEIINSEIKYHKKIIEQHLATIEKNENKSSSSDSSNQN